MYDGISMSIGCLKSLENIYNYFIMCKLEKSMQFNFGGGALVICKMLSFFFMLDG